MDHEKEVEELGILGTVTCHKLGSDFSKEFEEAVEAVGLWRVSQSLSHLMLS